MNALFTIAAMRTGGEVLATDYYEDSLRFTAHNALRATGREVAVRVVDSVEDAIEHVNSHGTGHSEAIVTASDEVAEAFATGVDAAAVYVNASTRFTDGFEYGMGAEIGNSTQKLHARGPIGLRELTSTTYVLHGSGQIRP